MDKQTYKIAVVGNRDAILPFRLIGFQTYPVTSRKKRSIPCENSVGENFGIIYLTEDIAQAIPDTVAFYDQQLTPALILIPTHRGTTGLGQQRIRDNVEKAVGQDIL